MKNQFKKTYFIADIAANHDGSLSRAKKLIKLCAIAGANAAKFQHFKAETIVSDQGFKSLGKLSHQSKWKTSIFDVYKKASIDNSWTPVLKNYCKKFKIDFLTAPYDLNYTNYVDKYVKYFKIGSGDITWYDNLKLIASKNKTVILATGASTLSDIENAINLIKKNNKKKIVLMQCNTNYTNSEKNFKYINLNVLKKFKNKFKNVTLGLSDHTEGHATVLGAIALGAKVVEKHFTDNNLRKGPDHKFSMNPNSWSEMIKESRRLELSLGDGNKKIEKNEENTVIVQRRGCWLKNALKRKDILKKNNILYLRPCPKNALSPFEIRKYFGKKILKNIKSGTALTKKCFQR